MPLMNMLEAIRAGISTAMEADEGRSFLVMELVEGMLLRHFIGGRPLDTSTSLPFR
jgi:hypothetical protein